jgi:hypothetical protein
VDPVITRPLNLEQDDFHVFVKVEIALLWRKMPETDEQRMAREEAQRHMDTVAEQFSRAIQHHAMVMKGGYL